MVRRVSVGVSWVKIHGGLSENSGGRWVPNIYIHTVLDKRIRRLVRGAANVHESKYPLETWHIHSRACSMSPGRQRFFVVRAQNAVRYRAEILRRRFYVTSRRIFVGHE